MADGHRSIKELLELMLCNQHLFSTGLCFWSWKLCEMGIISGIEMNYLDNYISQNRPLYKWYNFFTSVNHPYSGYYWEIGHIKPRIKWINKHIKKNS